MARYIDADYVIGGIIKRESQVELNETAKSWIDAFLILLDETANENGFDVVLCKDCKYWHDSGEMYGVVSGYCHNYDFPFNCETEPCMKADDFCSYGERKHT